MNETAEHPRSRWRRIGSIAAQVLLVMILIILAFVMWLPWVVSSRAGGQ